MTSRARKAQNENATVGNVAESDTSVEPKADPEETGALVDQTSRLPRGTLG